jgi:predicted ArsR family transcriptional regulator
MNGQPMSPNSPDRSTPVPRPAADRILVLLKTRGAQTAAALGAALGVTGEAVRQQLARLAADGLVAATAARRGVGRPAQVWALTAAGNARFPDTHAELTVQLIGAVRSVLGEEALDRLIEARAAESRAGYAADLEGAADLKERVARLAEARSREGYMAEWRPEGDGYLLVENHCPICAAAAACQGFCRTEREVFEQVLGEGVSVERQEHIVRGDRRCAYRVALKCVSGSGPGGSGSPGRASKTPPSPKHKRGKSN